MGGLLDRAEELDSLREAIEAAAGGRGGLVVVEGPAGIGKSRLLEAARQIAADAGLRSFTARGGELERDFAYGVVRQLFEAELAQAPEEERGRMLAGAGRLAAPVLGLENPHGVELTGADPAFAAMHGLYWLIVNLSSSQPLFVAVDDAHWADRASLRFMAYLLPRLEELPVLVAVATRPEEPGADLELLRHLGVQPGVAFVRPGPLGVEAIRSLAVAALGGSPGPHFITACHDATGGNPFLLGELLRSLAAEGVEPSDAAGDRVARLGPETVARSVDLRLSRAAPGAAMLARAVAVLGEHAEVHQAAAIAEIDPARASAIADELARAGLLEPGRPLRFAHPILRTAVYAGVPAGERGHLHAVAARVLEDSDAEAEAIGMHLLNVESAGRADVAHTLVRAAAQVIDRGAPELAVRLLDRALAEPSPADLRAEILYLRGTAEAGASSLDCMDTWRAALEERSEPETKARIAVDLAQAMVVADRQEEAVPVLEGVVKELSVRDEMLARRVEAELVMTAGLHSSTNAVAVERLTALGPTLLGQPPEADTLADRLLLGNMAFGVAAGGLASAEDVTGIVRRALGGDDLPPRDTWFAFGLAVLALAYADRPKEALEWFTRANDWAREWGSLLLFGMVSCWGSTVALRAGDVPRAETDAHAAIEVGHLSSWGAVNCERAFLADALLERGALTEAEQVLAERNLLGPLPPLIQANFIIETRARLRLAQGRAEDALADFLLCGENLEPVGTRNPALCPWRSGAALAAARLGRTEDALDWARQELELARSFGAPRAVGVALRALGLIKRGDEGRADLEAAVDVLETSEAVLERARALVDLGAAIRRLGHARDARETLLRGADLALRCGATRLVEQAHDELKATGARPRRLALSGVAALTGSERRVAELAAEGRTNKEIAQSLFVTLRTVEMHLSSTYRKLEIASRAELPGALAEEDSGLSLSV